VLKAGARVGAYEVVELLGAGGMGEVYRGRDRRLDRDVAIKVLPAEVADDAERLARFGREAKALARLSHPNILAIHEFGVDRGVTFAVTELLEGETLRERLGRGALPWRRAMEIAAAIADGLAAAHAGGVVHRDLKPENVFIKQDGHVKVLDFGLARLQEGPLADLETLTLPPPPGSQAGQLLGTVGYMSPEQVKGEPADARSDIFALGCLLHEMLTGGPPFKRDTAIETMTAVLRDEPPDVAISGVRATPELNGILERCLDKSPARRFQSAADLAFDLRSLAASAGARPHRLPPPGRRLLLGAAGAVTLIVVAILVSLWSPWRARHPSPALSPHRVVVLPFENNTGDASLEPLSRMASDWITQGLSRIDGLEVVPSTAVMFAQRSSHGKSGNQLAQVAAGTGAGLVVTGAYYRQGGSLQFQATITDAAHSRIVAALEPVTGDATSPMAAIDTVRERVLGAVAVNIGAAHDLGMQQRPPLYEAYREFILGFELFLRDDDAALRHFERAVEIDPTFKTPLMYAAYLWHISGQHARVGETLRDLMDHRDELTPLGRHWLDGFTAYASHRYGEALRQLTEAGRLAPRDPLIVHWIGLLSLFTNEPRRTVAAFAAFPTQPWGSHVLGDTWVYVHCAAFHMLGEHEREFAVAREAMAVQPGWWRAREAEIAALAALGRVDEAVRSAEACLVEPDMTGRAGEILVEAAEELRAHDHREASIRLATRAAAWYRTRVEGGEPGADSIRLFVVALQYGERWGDAAALLRRPGVLRPDSADDAGTLGCLAARQGDRQRALEASETLRQLRDPYLFGSQTYWRACIAAVLGDRDQAVALLRQAFAEGYPYGPDIHSDIDLESLRDYAPFVELLRPKG
jgi:serine/threonine protein kinase/tetratricopeptide (TPR) repeat protein